MDYEKKCNSVCVFILYKAALDKLSYVLKVVQSRSHQGRIFDWVIHLHRRMDVEVSLICKLKLHYFALLWICQIVQHYNVVLWIIQQLLVQQSPGERCNGLPWVNRMKFTI